MKRIGVLVALLVLVAALAVAGRWAWEFLAIDRCLDGGGRWDYHGAKCER